jgi:hypothetical protein
MPKKRLLRLSMLPTSLSLRNRKKKRWRPKKPLRRKRRKKKRYF